MSTAEVAQATSAAPMPTRPPRDARGFWRVLLAIVAPLAPLGTAAAILAQPYPVSADAAAALAGATAHPGAQQTALFLNLIPTFLIVPAVISLAWVTRRYTPKLTVVGTVLAVLGYTALIQLPNTDLVNLVAARQGIDPDKVIALVTAAQAHPVYVIGVLVFLLGHIVGQVLLGIALWRARVAPRWMPVVLIIALPTDVVAGAAGVNALAALAWVLTAIGFATASVALLRTRNDDFDLAPLPRKRNG
jgi:hypothetical protein